MKDWEAKHGNISQFDASKVDVMSIHEQVALNVSSVESKYHKNVSVMLHVCVYSDLMRVRVSCCMFTLTIYIFWCWSGKFHFSPDPNLRRLANSAGLEQARQRGKGVCW